jgi:hypothetical protein
MENWRAQGGITLPLLSPGAERRPAERPALAGGSLHFIGRLIATQKVPTSRQLDRNMNANFSESVISEIEARDHRVFTVAADEWISDEIETRLEADGYVFACSPENPDGTRRLYFARA